VRRQLNGSRQGSGAWKYTNTRQCRAKTLSRSPSRRRGIPSNWRRPSPLRRA
jgi:hypothetical protein